jgi:hypothetical protein
MEKFKDGAMNHVVPPNKQKENTQEITFFMESMKNINQSSHFCNTGVGYWKQHSALIKFCHKKFSSEKLS